MRAKDFREEARFMLSGQWWRAVLAFLLFNLLGGAGSFSIDIDVDTLRSYPELMRPFLILTAYGSLMSLLSFIIGGTIELGFCQYMLDLHAGGRPKISTLFSHFKQMGNGFCLRLLTGIYTALWTLLFIIPGIIAGYRYAMAPYIQADNPHFTASESIRASKELMVGNKWRLFCLEMSFIGWILLGLLTLGIGYLFLNPYMHAARAAFYRSISPYRPFRPDPEAAPLVMEAEETESHF